MGNACCNSNALEEFDPVQKRNNMGTSNKQPDKLDDLF